MASTAHRFSAGPVLRRSAGVLVRNLPALLVLTVIATAPVIVVALLAKYPAVGVKDGRALGAIVRFTVAVVVGAFAMGDLVAGAVTRAVLADLDGERRSFLGGLRGGLALLPALGVAIMTSLAIGAASAAVVLPGLVVLGLVYVAVPAAIAEGLGVETALRRSASLLRRRWPLGLALAAAPPLVATGLALAIGRVAVPHVLAGRARVPAPVHWHGYAAIVVAIAVASAVIAAVLAVVSYAALRDDDASSSLGAGESEPEKILGL